MSRLLREDDEFLYLSNYVHEEPDEFPEWLCGPDGRECPDPKWPQHIVEAEHYALYEVRIEYRIRKSDGEILLDKVS